MIIRHLSSDRMISSDYKNSTILFIVSIKIGTKIRSVYYFSFMKLIVSTFLVYKVKKCLLKSGKVIYWNQEKSVHQMVPLCPSVGLLVPVTRASVAHQVGIDSPCAGQPLPITRATSAQTSDLFLGYIDSLRYLKCIFAMFKMTFSDV